MLLLLLWAAHSATRLLLALPPLLLVLTLESVALPPLLLALALESVALLRLLLVLLAAPPLLLLAERPRVVQAAPSQPAPEPLLQPSHLQTPSPEPVAHTLGNDVAAHAAPPPGAATRTRTMPRSSADHAGAASSAAPCRA